MKNGCKGFPCIRFVLRSGGLNGCTHCMLSPAGGHNPAYAGTLIGEKGEKAGRGGSCQPVQKDMLHKGCEGQALLYG